MEQKTKLILIMCLIPVIGSVAVLGLYQVGLITGNVSVIEPITYTPQTFTVSIYPGDTKIQNITVSNSALNPIIVQPSVVVTPTSGLTATLSTSLLTIPAAGSVTFSVTLTATTIGTYTVKVTLTR